MCPRRASGFAQTPGRRGSFGRAPRELEDGRATRRGGSGGLSASERRSVSRTSPGGETCVVAMMPAAGDRDGDAMIRVMLVTEHTLLREELRRILQEDVGMEVIAEACDGSEAAPKASTLEPDVIIVDPTALEGLDAVKRLQDLAPESRIVILTMHSVQRDPRRLVGARTPAYVPRHAVATELIEAIRTVHAGKCYVTQELAGVLESPNGGRDLQENPLQSNQSHF